VKIINPKVGTPRVKKIVLRRNFLLVRNEVEGFLMVNRTLILILSPVICYAARKLLS